MYYTLEKYNKLYKVIELLPPDDLDKLDTICYALQPFADSVMPNRILALSVLELLEEYEFFEYNRD